MRVLCTRLLALVVSMVVADAILAGNAAAITGGATVEAGGFPFMVTVRPDQPDGRPNVVTSPLYLRRWVEDNARGTLRQES